MIDLDRYAILGVLGRGPRGIVYKARDQLTDSLVALKRIDALREGRAGSNLDAAWFVNDALAAWRLTHPNIVTVYAAGDAGGKVYIAMELLKGYSLRRELDADRSLGMGMLRSIKIAAGIASGLAYAHGQGVLHRNLKPSNITILGDDEVRISDFGIARMGDSALLSGGYARWLSYMSPEWIRGDEAIDGRSDIFSLGAVLYEMLTRTLPFNGGAPAEIVGEILEVEPRLPSELNPDVPPVLDGMVLNMLAKDSADRPAKVETILHTLRHLEEEFGERLPATAYSDEILTTTEGAALTTGVEAFGEHRETLLRPDETRIETRERWWITAVVFAGLGVLWLRYWAAPEPLVSATHAESAFEIASERSAARGSPTWEDLAKGGPTSLTATREPAASAEMTVSAAPLESELSVGAAAIVPGVKTAPHSTMAQAKRSQVKAGGGPPSKTATLTLAVSPWGAVYIDGKFHGTTPPVTTLDLLPGRHVVEVRNPSQPSYFTYATVRAGEIRSIRHEFESGQGFR